MTIVGDRHEPSARGSRSAPCRVPCPWLLLCGSGAATPWLPAQEVSAWARGGWWGVPRKIRAAIVLACACTSYTPSPRVSRGQRRKRCGVVWRRRGLRDTMVSPRRRAVRCPCCVLAIVAAVLVTAVFHALALKRLLDPRAPAAATLTILQRETSANSQWLTLLLAVPFACVRSRCPCMPRASRAAGRCSRSSTTVCASPSRTAACLWASSWPLTST